MQTDCFTIGVSGALTAFNLAHFPYLQPMEDSDRRYQMGYGHGIPTVISSDRYPSQLGDMA
jgi:hypothetical protein